MAPPVGPVSDQPSAKRKPWKIIAIVVGVLLLLCCVGGAVLVANSGKLFSTAAADAKVGDCLSGKKIDQSSDKFQKADLKVVKCSDPDALYKVVGRVEDRTQSQAQTDDNVCGAFADATNLYWQGREGEKGTVLCMKENK
jgi:flagellar basal body-associated protein FliL